MVDRLKEFMHQHKIFGDVAAEIHNIGNEELEEIFEDIESGEIPALTFFEDDHHIQWDTPVTYVDWEKINGLWKGVCNGRI